MRQKLDQKGQLKVAPINLRCRSITTYRLEWHISNHVKDVEDKYISIVVELKLVHRGIECGIVPWLTLNLVDETKSKVKMELTGTAHIEEMLRVWLAASNDKGPWPIQNGLAWMRTSQRLDSFLTAWLSHQENADGRPSVLAYRPRWSAKRPEIWVFSLSARRLQGVAVWATARLLDWQRG